MSRSTFSAVGLVAAIVIILSIANSYTGETPQSGSSPTPEPAATQAVVTSVSYKGSPEKNAFELLREIHQVDYDQTDLGVQINAIDGELRSQSKIWFFYINGERSSLSADQYVTKPNDTIEWRLELAQP